MRGCGRQRIGATINLATYWVLGLPAAVALAFWGGLGALGLWAGLACTASLQALIMTHTVFRWVQVFSLYLELKEPGEEPGERTPWKERMLVW